MPSGLLLYLAISIVCGIGQIVDGFALLNSKGRLSPLLLALAQLELAWAVVSFCVSLGDRTLFPKWLPASFVAYFFLFFAAGLVVRSRNRGREPRVPRFLVFPGIIFGAYFAGLSACFLYAALVQ